MQIIKTYHAKELGLILHAFLYGEFDFPELHDVLQRNSRAIEELAERLIELDELVIKRISFESEEN